ncbi:glycosyltransferase (plasmid) [Deinococcus sp. KNUC1210]|uniref:glycosyltransferase n=1 Tax=Deinococcus sp. KNUC1210 TaxID=2917691 RepID=UPI001EF04BA6|nr:glycosyltransferase [Deinococcus sp. KNUC1210]ULH17600.1 glycosyltransferase [Deinococcus sp. KNUC1210]
MQTEQTNPQSGTAAIVVTYNRRALLVQCLERLLSQTLPLERIYVIDNASTDGTAEVIPAHERIEYLRLSDNLGGPTASPGASNMRWRPITPICG